jgi:hypothetical protein
VLAAEVVVRTSIVAVDNAGAVWLVVVAVEHPDDNTTIAVSIQQSRISSLHQYRRAFVA